MKKHNIYNRGLNEDHPQVINTRKQKQRQFEKFGLPLFLRVRATHGHEQGAKRIANGLVRKRGEINRRGSFLQCYSEEAFPGFPNSWMIFRPLRSLAHWCGS